MTLLSARTCAGVATSLVGLLACVQSPLGRQQILFFPAEQVAQMGAEAFAKMKSEMPLDNQPADSQYVRCVTEQLASALQGSDAPDRWEIAVFRDEAANAFALPGGKIGVNSGMLKVADDPALLATVLAHEIGHVIASHTNERLSTTSLAESGLGMLQVLAGGSSPAQQQLMGLLGVGAQFGLLMPFNRAQESEADQIGLELMARAGFDPRQSVALWRRMEQAGGGEPPEFLSTHPSSASRIAALQRGIPGVMPLYERAARAGGANCRVPSRRSR